MSLPHRAGVSCLTHVPSTSCWGIVLEPWPFTILLGYCAWALTLHHSSGLLCLSPDPSPFFWGIVLEPWPFTILLGYRAWALTLHHSSGLLCLSPDPSPFFWVIAWAPFDCWSSFTVTSQNRLKKNNIYRDILIPILQHTPRTILIRPKAHLIGWGLRGPHQSHH